MSKPTYSKSVLEARTVVLSVLSSAMILVAPVVGKALQAQPLQDNDFTAVGKWVCWVVATCFAYHSDDKFSHTPHGVPGRNKEDVEGGGE